MGGGRSVGIKFQFCKMRKFRIPAYTIVLMVNNTVLYA